MNNRSLHHYYRRIRPLSFWYFLLAAVIFFVIGGVAYRQNNVAMLKYREAVLVADEQNGNVETALRELREYIYAHMNTDLTPKRDSIRPPIQLKYRYERLTADEKARVSKINEKVYSDAQAVCERKYPTGYSGRGRVPCITEYVASHGAVAKTVPDSLYKFDFVNPTWTFDFAGWMLSIALFLFFLAIVRFGLERWIHSRLN